LKFATLRLIGRSLGVSHVSILKYVKNHYLVSIDGKIDIENPQNKQFLESKGADFSVFDGSSPVKKQEKIQKPVKKPLKPAKTEHKSIKKEDIKPEIIPEIVEKKKPVKEKQSLLELEIELKMANLKAREKDSELKTIKIEELRGKLIERQLAEQYISDTVGAFTQALVNIPFAVVDQIINIIDTDSNKKREDVIALLQTKYVKEIEKASERGYNRYIRELKDRLREAEQAEKEAKGD